MIVSTTNSKVKRLTALTHKAKARRDEGVFVAEGIKMFLEAPEEWIQEIYVSEIFLEKMHNDKSGNSGKNKQLMDTLSKQKYEVVSEEVYKKISDTQTPQGILAVLPAAAFFGAGGCTISGWKRNIFYDIGKYSRPRKFRNDSACWRGCGNQWRYNDKGIRRYF